MKHLALIVSLLTLVVAVFYTNQKRPSSSTLGISKASDNYTQVSTEATNKQSEKAEDIKLILPFETTSTAILIQDLNSDNIYYEKNADLLISPASTTKILTALVAIDVYDLNDILIVPRIDIDGQKMGLFKGERISFEGLLYGMLVFSANDAAETIAENYKYGREEFIKLLNSKASEIGAYSSNFTNPTGLNSKEHYTTASDMALISKEAIKSEVIRKIVGTKQVRIYSQDLKSAHSLENTNKLLGVLDGVKGIKTGWTEESRENLITYLEKDSKKALIMVFGSDDRFGETKKLVDWYYSLP